MAKSSIVDAEAILAIDIGAVNTRASLFDVVEGQYHYIATGIAHSTVDAPYRDAGEGVHLSLMDLQQVSGRMILDQDYRLVVPVNKEGLGVDKLVITYSAGPALRVVAVGLLEEVSLESARNLVAPMGAAVVEKIGLGDPRRLEVQMDAILQANPDLIVVSGGTENGANRSIAKLVELVLLVCRLLPSENRPQVLYAGNSQLAQKVEEVLQRWTTVYLAPNIRPTIEKENLGPAQEALIKAINKIRSNQIGGLSALSSVSQVMPQPSSHTFGRMIRFLSQVYDPSRGVIGLDLGAQTTTLAAGKQGNLFLNVYPYGMGSSIRNLLRVEHNLEGIYQWLAVNVSREDVSDYIWQKSLFPTMAPMSEESLAIEMAVARQILHTVWQNYQLRGLGGKSSFEPYIISGMVFSHAPDPSSSLLALLDGLQPAGITTFVLDQHSVLSALGAIAPVNSLLPVQALETGAMTNLGTVICPVSSARNGAMILRARLEFDDGHEEQFDIRKGSIFKLPVRNGQTVRIHLDAFGRTALDPASRKRSAAYKIIGGVCGAVIDARGRPVVFPNEPSRRMEWLNRWKESVR